MRKGLRKGIDENYKHRRRSRKICIWRKVLEDLSFSLQFPHSLLNPPSLLPAPASQSTSQHNEWPCWGYEGSSTQNKRRVGANFLQSARLQLGLLGTLGVVMVSLSLSPCLMTWVVEGVGQTEEGEVNYEWGLGFERKDTLTNNNNWYLTLWGWSILWMVLG